MKDAASSLGDGIVALIDSIDVDVSVDVDVDVNLVPDDYNPPTYPHAANASIEVVNQEEDSTVHSFLYIIQLMRIYIK